MEEFNAACVIQSTLQEKLWLWKINNNTNLFNDDEILGSVPAKIKNNLAIVVAAVKKSGLNLEYVKSAYKNDFAIVMLAVSSGWGNEDYFTFQEVNNSITYDKYSNYHELYERAVAFPIQFASRKLQNNARVVKASLKRHGGSIIKLDRSGCTNYKYDHDMIMIALQDEDMKFMLLEKRIRWNKYYLLVALCNVYDSFNENVLFRDILDSSDPKFKDDPEVMHLVLSRNACMIKELSENLKYNLKFLNQCYQGPYYKEPKYGLPLSINKYTAIKVSASWHMEKIRNYESNYSQEMMAFAPEFYKNYIHLGIIMPLIKTLGQDVARHIANFVQDWRTKKQKMLDFEQEMLDFTIC